MANFTYADLAARIATMTQEQLNSDVMVYVAENDEYYSLMPDFPMVESDPETVDVLDPNHPYLVI